MAAERRPSAKAAIHLWEFLLDLLADERYTALIGWTNREGGEFKLKNQEEVARKWGDLKHRPGMNYDKLSRALRYYYQKGIIKKVNGQRLVYKFCNPPLITEKPVKSIPPPLIPIADVAKHDHPSSPLISTDIGPFPVASKYIPLSVPMSPFTNSSLGFPVLSPTLRMSEGHVTYQYMLPVLVPRCHPVAVITKS